MASAATSGLQAALAGRLGEVAAAALLALPIESRQKALAQALGADDAAALRLLSELSGLPVLPEPAVDSEGVRRLPARLAAESQAVPVLLPGSSPERLELAVAWPPEAAARSAHR